MVHRQAQQKKGQRTDPYKSADQVPTTIRCSPIFALSSGVEDRYPLTGIFPRRINMPATLRLLPSVRAGLPAAGILLLATLVLPVPAAAQGTSPQEAQKQRQEIAARLKADQAQCRKLPGQERQPCLDQARAREHGARAELDARTRPAVSGNVASGRGAVGAGQYGHVAPDGSMVVGGRDDLPASSSKAALRSADDLKKQKMPSNQPVDVTKAARAVQGTRP
jgi:hypothetical protein